MENYTEVKTVKVRKFCDKCKDVELEFTGVMLMSYPPRYQYRCPKCWLIHNLKGHYPKIEYIESE